MKRPKGQPKFYDLLCGKCGRRFTSRNRRTQLCPKCAAQERM